MPDETLLEPRLVVWRCDHCRNRIDFDAVQLAGRATCRVPCPHCGRETSLQEPPPPPRLVPDEGWRLPAQPETTSAPEPGEATKTMPTNAGPIEPRTAVPPWLLGPEAGWQAAPAAPPKPDQKPADNVKDDSLPAATVGPAAAAPPAILVTLPPDPPPPQTRAPVDVRWLTDLGVVYFRQHQFGEAFHCFSRAAQQDFATAQFCLAVCHFNGHGTAQDEAAALPWLQKAATQGDANAEFMLGMAYRLGRGAPANPLLAAQWLRQAAAHGHAEAAARLQEANPSQNVPDTMTPAAVAPAKTAEAPPDKKPNRELQRLVLGFFKNK